jgi:AraC-like DNA-binding protein
VPELDASHEQVDVRTPGLRIGVHCGRNVTSDYALLHRAAPFLHHLRRSQLVIMLAGHGRYDENGRREWLRPGVVALTDQGCRGTDSFGGATYRCLLIEWDAREVGASVAGPVRVETISSRALAALDDASHGLAGNRPAQAMSTIVALLRAWGLDLARQSARDLENAADDAEDDRVQVALSEHLSSLHAKPAITDLVQRLRLNERQLSRRIGHLARRYGLPWVHWRAALHHTRLLQATRLLAARGATTEVVARLTGFRAPSALCHAFDKGRLPPPGVLARAARHDALDGWTEFAFPRAGADRAA